MSETWPGLSGTGFPDVIDPYQIYVDINEQNYTQIEEIQTDITNHDFAGAKAILEANPTLSNCIVTAATLQRFEDQIIAIQKTWKSSIINQIANIVTYKETYRPTTSYKLFDIISYSNKAYMCTSDDSITGILPTNQDYWIPIVLQGISGGTMAFYTTWSSSQEYKVQDLVPYGSSLYVCITQNTNQIPPDSPDYWHVALVSGKQTIWSENQPENQVTGDEWKQTNSNDSSYITHLRQDSGYITKYPTSNADFIQETTTAGKITKLSCTKSGTVFQLTGLNATSGKVACIFEAPATYTAGDTFTIDGAAYTIYTTGGEALRTGAFHSVDMVSVILHANLHVIHFYQAEMPTAEQVGAVTVLPTSTLTAEQLDNASFLYSYETRIAPEIAVQIGLSHCWYHLKYFSPYNNGGYGAQEARILNGESGNEVYHRNSIANISWSDWKNVADGGHASTADYASGNIALGTAGLRNITISTSEASSFLGAGNIHLVID